MRLICTLNDQQNAHALSSYLTSQKIENQIETVVNSDWGSPDYGSMTCRIWVVDEDQYEKGEAIADDFLKDPTNPRFHLSAETISHYQQDPRALTMGPEAVAKEREPLGRITSYILTFCTLLLIASALMSPSIKVLPTTVPYEPLLLSPINKVMLIDYPKAYEIVDALVAKFGPEKLDTPEELPPEGQQLFQELYSTPYWKGFYPQLVARYKDRNATFGINAPLFEKVRQGEVWRLWSPIFLHSDIFHLFFNMIWLIVLGKQLEERLGRKRYLLFIALTALISNVAQYFMSGPNFVGFSGVLCAMLTFIWFRQKRAPWEGYQLEGSTMGFVTFFILFVFAVQVVLFFVETHSESTMSVGIANTAHLTGGLMGYILSRFNFFAWR